MDIFYKIDRDVHVYMYVYVPCISRHLHTSELWA